MSTITEIDTIRQMICEIFPLISERILILNLDEVLAIQAVAAAEFKDRPFSIDPESQWAKTANILTGMKKVLQDTWRYARKDPNGREPVPGNKIRPRIQRMVFVQAYSQKIFTLVEFQCTKEFTIKKIGKLEVRGAMIEQRVFVTEPDNVFPIDWGAFELV